MSSKSRAVQNVDPAAQQVQQAQAYDHEIRETKASANAQAGLNLNILAGLNGNLFSRSKKTTETDPDGSSHSVEHRETAATGDGVGRGNLSMVGQATAKEQTREADVKGLKTVDHLGIKQ